MCQFSPIRLSGHDDPVDTENRNQVQRRGRPRRRSLKGTRHDLGSGEASG
jgi:hypothetical protein